MNNKVISKSEKIKILASIAVFLLMPFIGMLYLIQSDFGLKIKIFSNGALHNIFTLFLTFTSFYGSYLYYLTYVKKKNIRDFVFSLSFYVFGITFLIHLLSSPSISIFSESFFKVTEVFGVFLGVLFLFPLVFLKKQNVKFIYKKRTEFFFFVNLILFSTLLFFVYQKWIIDWLNINFPIFSFLTFLLLLIILFTRLYFILQGRAERHIFLAIGIAVFSSYGFLYIFEKLFNYDYGYSHLILVISFLFILISWFQNKEFNDFRVVFKNAELKTKIIVSFSALILIFFSIIFYYYLNTLELFQNKNLTFLQVKTEEKSFELKTLFSNALKDLKYPISLKEDISILDLKNILQEIIVENNYSSAGYFSFKNNFGFVVYPEKTDNLNSFKLNDPGLYLGNNKDDFFVVVVPYTFSNDGIESILFLSLGKDKFNNVFLNTPKNNDFTFLIFNKKVILFSNQNINLDSLILKFDELSQKDSFLFADKNSLMAYVKRVKLSNIVNADLWIGTGMPYALAVESVVLLKEKIASFIFLFMLLFVMVSYYLVEKLTLPVRRLADITQKITDGELDKRAEVKSKDEIGRLALSFNNMVDRFVYTNMNLEDMVKERTRELNRKMIQIESQIQETKKFQKAVESATDGIVIADKFQNIIYANKAWQNITGVSAQSIYGKNILEIFGRDVKDEVIRKAKNALEKGKLFVTEDVAGTRKNKEKYEVRISLFPVKDRDDIIFYVALVQDITKRKEIDKAKTEFVSLASHQLRTPLSIVNWRTEMLLDGAAGKLTKKQRKFLEDIYKGNRRMIDLVNSLLNVSRIELGTLAIEPEEIDVRKVCDEALSELTNKIAEKKLKIKKEYAKDIPIIKADKKLIFAIFQNLLSNAVKYTDKGYVKIKIYNDKNKIHIEVEDTGIGIPKRQQKEVFSKLFRADNAKAKVEEGTGLGLYIIKSVLDKIGGKIWFRSEENKGTVFHVLLPKKPMKKREGRGRII